MNENRPSPISNIRLSADALKIFAVIAMLCDHLAYGVIFPYALNNAAGADPAFLARMTKLNDWMRGFGRLAFPIFAFFLVEGFFHTRNVFKYAIRLAVFAIISEYPFDMALFGSFPYNAHQNVLFEMLCGLIMLIILNTISERLAVSDLLKSVLYLCTLAAFVEISSLLKLDYNYKGMILFFVLFVLHECKELRTIAGAAAVSWEKFAPISFVLIYFYDPDKKRRLRYFFYLFYPVHLGILAVIRHMLGI